MFPHASKLAHGAVALFGFALFLTSAPANAQTPVEFGAYITEPGVYFLRGNQTGSGVGIRIGSDDVALFLGRFTLRGDGTGLGITSTTYKNVLVEGGRVTNFQIGVNMTSGEDITVRGMRIDHCLQSGLRIVNVEDSAFVRVRCDYNGGDGVEAQDVDNCRFLSILAHDNGGNGIRLLPFVPPPPLAGTGIDGSDSTNNKIKLCWAAYNGLDGIRVLDGDDNEIERNQCVNNHDAGIRLGSFLLDSSIVNAPGSQRNFLRSNWCVFNGEGIRVEWASSDNTLTNNTALANFMHDMVDRNFERPCVNTWFLNFFLTKDGDGAECIF